MAASPEIIVLAADDTFSVSGATSSTLSQSFNSTPASTVESPCNGKEDERNHASEVAEDGHDGHETPRERTKATKSIQKQLEQVQAKLALFQQQLEMEHHGKGKLEQRMTEEIFPYTDPGIVLNGSYLRSIMSDTAYNRRHGYAPESDPEFSDGELDPDNYLSRAIFSYKMGLNRLENERGRVKDMKTERDQLVQSRNKLLEERQKLLAGLHLSEEPKPNPGHPPDYPAPMLDYLDWAAFSASFSSRPYAIDVLVGEPTLTFRNPNLRHSYFRPGSQEPTKPRTLPSKHYGQSQEHYDGSTPLPERIRINSTHIRKILDSITNRDSASSNDPCVMTRPYKMLIHYAEPLRDKLEELKKRFCPTVLNQSSMENLELTKPTENDGEEKPHDAEDDLTSSPTALQDLDCLYEFITKFLYKKMAYMASDRCRTVSFADMWYLFKPGDEVVEQSRRQAYRIINVTAPGHRAIAPWEKSWRKAPEADDAVVVQCVYVDFDGKELGPVSKRVQIDRFDGEKAITSLPRYSDRPPATLREGLIARGRTFLEVTTFKHMYYSGVTLETRDEIDSHVVVDFVEAFAANKWRPTLEYLIGSTPEEVNERACNAACCQSQKLFASESFVDKKRNDEYMALLVPDDGHKQPSPAICPRLLEDIKSQATSLSEDDMMIMSSRVCGFVLHSRKWEKLDPSFLAPPKSSPAADSHSTEDGPLSPIGESEEDQGKSSSQQILGKNAFDQLVLPDGHKDMVRSLIAQHLRDKEAAKDDSRASRQVDIVHGKGKGLIILLHGAPGVGKTSTAEGVAQMFRKPLYQLTCGDLGTTASEVEAELEKHFTLASRWGCVLLLDEADVFLAARSREDFVRNGLVSVFLRILEYYSGILFLTTNRVGDFDEAFTSRIHISLHYPQLDWDSTEAIFDLNLSRIIARFDLDERPIDVEKLEIIQFAEKYFHDHPKERWNGRQIRNACQTALALAEFRSQGNSHELVKYKNAKVYLKVKDFEKVTTAYLEFIKYLKDVHGEYADPLAKRLKLRRNESVPENKKPPTESQTTNNPAKDKFPTHPGNIGTMSHTTLMSNAPPQPHLAPPSPGPTAAPPAGQPSGYNPVPGYPPGFSYPFNMGYGQPPAAPGLPYGAPPPTAPPTAPMWSPEAMTAFMHQQAAQQQAHVVQPADPRYAMPPNPASNPAS